jgi:hypothetical protein
MANASHTAGAWVATTAVPWPCELRAPWTYTRKNAST